MDAEGKAYLEAAAKEVYRQMEENPGLPVPVDPDVAEYMGAFEDDALDLADAFDDVGGMAAKIMNANMAASVMLRSATRREGGK